MRRNQMKVRNVRKRTNFRGWVFVVVFCVLLCSLFAVDVHAGECENAMMRCISDPYWHATLAGPVYCATGYLFCKKYVEG
jgi:nicotinamide riboside transporter PnuC